VKRAIISDVHGNLEALQAVLEDIDRERVDAIFCLGDIVGYGPNPCECVRLVRDRCSLVLLGNHDQGALFDPDGFNVGAERAIRWTRSQLEAHDRLPRNAQAMLSDYIGELPRTHTDGDAMFVHGSARRPLDEYVFPEDIYSPAVAEARIELPADKAMVNVGSVGQPRDGDPRACYAIVEDNAAVRFRRLQYPWETTCRKIHAIADLDNFLGDRLGQGR